MPEAWIHLGLPAFSWIVLYLSETRSIRADLERAQKRFQRAQIRQLEAIEQDQVRIVGKVVSPDGGSINLGTSVESPETIRHNPALEGESFVVETSDGRRFRIRSGKARIEGLPGAERKLVRTVTTESGVEQTYSFEVPDGFELMVVGTRSRSADEGAFRGGPIDLAPLEDGYRIGEKLSDVRAALSPPKVDTDKSVSIIGGFFALAAVAFGYMPYVGPFLWYPAMIIMAMVAFVFLFGTSAVEPLPAKEKAKLEALRIRVSVEDTDEDEVEERLESEDSLEEASVD